MGVVAWIAQQQWFQRFTRLRKFVPRDQHLHIFMTRLVMVRHHRQNTCIQRFCIVEHVTQMTDLCKQAHRFGMVAGLYKKAADQSLGGIYLTIAMQHFGVNDGLRQAGEAG